MLIAKRIRYLLTLVAFLASLSLACNLSQVAVTPTQSPAIRESTRTGQAFESPTPDEVPRKPLQELPLMVNQAAYYAGDPSECWYDPSTRSSLLTADSGFVVIPDSNDGSSSAPLLFTIIVHIEPQSTYDQLPVYERDRDRLTRLADILAAHNGKLTIQTQRPFITTSQRIGDDIHRQWTAKGHEVAIHFHENEYVQGEPGKFGADVAFEEWVAALGGLQNEIQSLVEEPIDTWSGGNLYPRLWESAEVVGLSVNTNYKDPSTQGVPALYLTVSPWRPSTDEPAVHNPNGPVIYLPAGIYPAHCQKPAAVPRPYTSQALDYLTTALIHSMNAARTGYVNVAYTTMHPGDFKGPNDDEDEFARWEEWLSSVIDPLATDGRLVWATASEMADRFMDWETNQ